MTFTLKTLRLGTLLMLCVSCIALSACGDSNVAHKPQEQNGASVAAHEVSETDNRTGNVKAGSRNTSAAELVAEHAIHWSHPNFFPAELLGGETGWQAMYTAHAKLEKVSSNENVVMQIRKCHENTREARLIAAGYNFENSTLMRNYNDRVASYKAQKGRYLDKDVVLYFFGLLETHQQTLTSEQFEAVSDKFWQWCVALPNTHWSGRYQDNPIRLE
ncbi:hypothetical protein Q3O59_10210 [Alkalimonas delamerensis]|uniref:Uncharacterized protein n=1 Tax=Alkalimonas delamerensis TaxID=265981 RepID=A0ABT9GR16_9GAMM|nr:hypothetical protein [Alkalimonas delamerensis]MDP4529396.1 hypothetical protein [Alkalimonas delamerensis]